MDEARALFARHRAIDRILATLDDVGLGYLTLGQRSSTLSGGEAQRVKLSRELARPSAGRTLYLLDEPTTGLHFQDVHRLLGIVVRLVDAGNTVLIVAHDLDVVQHADHVIDLGPEGGDEGGRLVASGTPEEVAGRRTPTPGAACGASSARHDLDLDAPGRIAPRPQYQPKITHVPSRPGARRDASRGLPPEAGSSRFYSNRSSTMRSTSVHLPTSLVDDLDRLAARRGLSRNRLILEACQALLDAERGDWPEDMFASELDPEHLEELRSAGAEMEDEIYAARRDRQSPPL